MSGCYYGVHYFELLAGCFANESNGIVVELQQRLVLLMIGTNLMMIVVLVVEEVVHTMDFDVLSLRLDSVHRLDLFA